ncbi:nicotinamide riboside kinase [Bacillus mesophilus]|uniref:Peptidase M14 domain-containing protein n=1 Tax=Bacillus mesophilus TaxID=1808955 RepID=A0A6M0Q7G3_9BACI|nr:M14 family metallocarboxypeptidase [Bacillus mesophilus]MBM7661606.1 nicotinamide riboside kinase [Bacillus mesophilus]NEY72275.1 hypothetical protein [Bacillus mesophilus]
MGKKITALFLILLLLANQVHLIVSATSNITVENGSDSIEYYQVNVNTELLDSEGRISGVLQKDAIIRGVQENEKILLLLGETQQFLDIQNVTLLENYEDNGEHLNEESSSTSIGEIISANQIDILSLNEEKILLHLSPNQKIQVISTENNYYKIDFAGTMGRILLNDSIQFSPLGESGNLGEESTENKQAELENTTNLEQQNEEQTITTIIAENIVKVNSTFTKETQFFEVTKRTAIYVKVDGTLIRMGAVDQGQMYERLNRDLSSWHQIKFGDGIGYVKAEYTIPANGSQIKNKNVSYSNSGYHFKPKLNIAVYDTSSGSSIQFASIYEGVTYPLIADIGDWYRVDIAGRIGFVRERDVVRTPSIYDTHFEVIARAAIYVKEGDSLVRVGAVDEGQVYPRLNRDVSGWQQIAFGNKIGYVRSEYTKPGDASKIQNLNTAYKNPNLTFKPKLNIAVYDTSSGTSVQFASLYEGITYPFFANIGDWYRVDVAGRIGYIRERDVERTFSNYDTHFEVTTRTAVYIKEGDQLIRAGAVDVGQVYPRLNRDVSSWQQISFGNGIGYIRSQYTKPGDASKIQNLNTLYKNSNLVFKPKLNIAVYDTSSGSSVQFASLYEGVTYPLIADIGDWYRVDIAGRTGYIRERDVELIFTEDTQYFEVLTRTAIYIKEGGVLVKVGAVDQGEMYPRSNRDLSSWHQVKFGNGIGYVNSIYTKPADGSKIKNLNNSEPNSSVSAKPKLNIAVYDNTSGQMVRFASLYQGKVYPIIEDIGSWLKVDLAGRIGYIAKSNVDLIYTPTDVVNPKQEYTYEEMRRDLLLIQNIYPGLVELKTIGKSVDGRNIYAIKVGKGSTEIFFNASHHGREHITTNLVMEMIDQYTRNYALGGTFGGYNVKQILDNTSIWFVPMVNPDGVTLVQRGHTTAKNPDYVLKLNNNNLDFSSWKANIRGVDLNRQYPADWENIRNNPGVPGPQNYKGTAPLTEPEVVALYNFVLNHNFKTAVSYHSSGEILYWHFHQSGARMERDYQIAKAISNQTGYRIVDPVSNPSGGGFTDWFISTRLQPGFTPEVSPYTYGQPVPLSNYDAIWLENRSVGLMLAKEAFERN